jgi:hypothetical protein
MASIMRALSGSLTNVMVVVIIVVAGEMACAVQKRPIHQQVPNITISSLPSNDNASSITGSVIDAFHKGIPGAIIQIESRDNHTKRGTTSDSDGYFRMVNVAPGRYSIKIEAVGYSLAHNKLLELPIKTELQVICTLPENGYSSHHEGQEPHIDLDSPRAKEVIYIEGEPIPRVETR